MKRHHIHQLVGRCLTVVAAAAFFLLLLAPGADAGCGGGVSYRQPADPSPSDGRPLQVGCDTSAPQIGTALAAVVAVAAAGAHIAVLHKRGGDAAHKALLWSDDPVFNRLINQNHLIRNTPLTQAASSRAQELWPARTISTALVTGTVNGKRMLQSVAAVSGGEKTLRGTAGATLASLPPEGQRIFRTRRVDGGPRHVDSEPKMLEKLTRDILRTGSGCARGAVENAIREAIKGLPTTESGYPQRAKDVIAHAAETLGMDLTDVDLTIDMVVDFPRGVRDGLLPRPQMCASCSSLVGDFKKAFDYRIIFNVRNLLDEPIWEDPR